MRYENIEVCNIFLRTFIILWVKRYYRSYIMQFLCELKITISLICPSLCEHVHQGFVYNKSPRSMSRRKEGRSPNRWAEKEAGDGKYLQGDVFTLHYGIAFQWLRWRTVAKHQSLTMMNWVDSMSLYWDVEIVFVWVYFWRRSFTIFLMYCFLLCSDLYISY